MEKWNGNLNSEPSVLFDQVVTGEQENARMLSPPPLFQTMPAASALEREIAFFRLAPNITSKQKTQLIAALVADVARTVVLIIALLTRVSFAGKEIKRSDVKKMFGPQLSHSDILPSRLLNKLLMWLKANKRSEFSFKLCNPTLIDMSLQKLFAYWPKLLISLNVVINSKHEEEVNEIESSFSSDAFYPNCVVALCWQDKFNIDKIFKEPDSFIPNANII